MAAERPIFRTASEAWEIFKREVGPIPPEHSEAVLCGVFLAGMSSALSIGYHYGFAELRAELERAQYDA